MTVSELDEALFSKEVWFDVADDVQDKERMDALLVRDQLLEDLDKVNAQQAVSEAILNGAIFGTGILKINVEVVKEATPTRAEGTGELVQKEDEVVRVYWESIRPDEFIPDPAGRNIGEMLGCGHKVKKPRHSILEKIESGLYRKDAAEYLFSGLRGNDNDLDPQDPQSLLTPDEGDEIEILEYHGKVPVSMLTPVLQKSAGESPIDDVLKAAGEDSLVEAIVTVANGSVLLRAMVNPFTMRDRSIIAFQFERVPGRFWGRGVAEKGFNPQKALDAEIRARIDALGYVSSPMLAVDGGRVPRGFKLEVKPGKVWITQGPPQDVLTPVQIGALEPNTFNQASEMERMVQMATGAFDTAAGVANQGSAQNGPSSTNLSLLMGAFVKRGKRAIRNVNDALVVPALKKTMWRYMQFAPRHYPNDFDIRVMATMGIVAREVEAMQLTQLMGMMPEQFPQVTATVAKGIIDLGSLHNKAEIVQAIDQATAPPSQEDQQRQKQMQDLQFQAVAAETQGKMVENSLKMAQTRKFLADALLAQKQAGKTDQDSQLEMMRLQKEIEELDVARETNRVNLVKAHLAYKTAVEKPAPAGQ